MPTCTAQELGISSNLEQERQLIDPAVVRFALTLTAIGIGTAFGLLLLLMFVVSVMRLLVQHVLERPNGISILGLRSPVARTRQEQSDKALAAIAAVTILLAERGQTTRS
jgi:Na+-transporting methylmalonyl-CoA/oxaloacetate decarboxylase gamma subunit